MHPLVSRLGSFGRHGGLVLSAVDHVHQHARPGSAPSLTSHVTFVTGRRKRVESSHAGRRREAARRGGGGGDGGGGDGGDGGDGGRSLAVWRLW